MHYVEPSLEENWQTKRGCPSVLQLQIKTHLVLHRFFTRSSLQEWNHSSGRRPGADLDVFTLVRLYWACLVDRHWLWLCRSSWTPCTSTSRGSTSSRRRTTPPRCSISSPKSSAPSSSLRPSSPPSQPIRTSWWVIDSWDGFKTIN